MLGYAKSDSASNMFVNNRIENNDAHNRHLNNINKHIYLQPHRVGFTCTVIYKQHKIQGNKMRRNVIRKVIHTATQRDTQSDTYFH